MKTINKGFKKGYLIHKTSTGIYSVCRILNEYDNKDDATNALVKVLCKDKSEKDLLREYTRVEMNGIWKFTIEKGKCIVYYLTRRLQGFTK